MPPLKTYLCATGSCHGTSKRRLLPAQWPTLHKQLTSCPPLWLINKYPLCWYVLIIGFVIQCNESYDSCGHTSSTPQNFSICPFSQYCLLPSSNVANSLYVTVKSFIIILHHVEELLWQHRNAAFILVWENLSMLHQPDCSNELTIYPPAGKVFTASKYISLNYC